MKHFSSFLSSGLATALLLAGPLARAQAPAWQAATACPGTGNAAITASAADASGNVYLAGSFSGTLTLGGTVLTSAGGQDAFVARWNPATAAFVWAQRAGGTSDEYAKGLAVSGSSVYVVGGFDSPTASFGATTLTKTGTLAGRADIFVARLADTGGFGWAQGMGGLYDDYASAVAVSGANVYVAGYFSGPTVSFGATTLTASSAGSADVFVAKFTDAGSAPAFGWALGAGGPSNDYAFGMAVLGSSVYLTGTFFGASATFGGATIANADASPFPTTDAFVAKAVDAGSSGSFAWARPLGGLGYESGAAVAVSSAGVYAVGNFRSASLPLGATTLANADASGSTNDVFVAKLADAGASGSVAWAQRAGGPADDRAAAVAASGAQVYVAGGFRSAGLAFGGTTLANTDASGSTYDAFVAKLADAGASGSAAWAQRAGGPADDAATALLLQGPAVLTGGYFSGPTASFGALTLAAAGATGATAFLASLPDPALTATTAARGGLRFGLVPNPARAAATLTLPAGPGAAAATLTDALGRVVRTQALPLPARSHTLDLRGLAPGVYAVRVQAGDSSATQRLVVE